MWKLFYSFEPILAKQHALFILRLIHILPSGAHKLRVAVEQCADTSILFLILARVSGEVVIVFYVQARSGFLGVDVIYQAHRIVSK